MTTFHIEKIQNPASNLFGKICEESFYMATYSGTREAEPAGCGDLGIVDMKGRNS
jgi:hypothetical protein